MPGGATQSTGSEAAHVEAKVASRLAPSAEFLARVADVRERLVTAVTTAAKARSSPLLRALVAGSAARATFLQDRLDIDLFLLFPPDLPRDRLREEGLALGRAVLSNTETRYAEHPYLRGTFDGFSVDAVPGFAITDPAHPISPVDRTPFHQEYLAARETPAHVVEVRLTKQFLRSRGVYGSEARTEGFSGYLIELLVLRYGSFRGILEAARTWRIPARLEPPEKEPPRLPDEVALVLTDPVDPHRNVASALSRRNLGLTILAAGAYLDHPAEAWFDLPKPSPFSRKDALARVAERATHVVVLSLPRPALVDDTLYPQVRKAERAIADEISRAGFEVIGSGSSVDAGEVAVAVEVAHRLRSAVRRRDGPPPGIGRVEPFLEKWTAAGVPVVQGPYVRADGSLAVETAWPDRDVESVLLASLPRLSLGKNLSPDDPASVKVHPVERASESEAVTEALERLLAKRLAWPAARPPRSRSR